MLRLVAVAARRRRLWPELLNLLRAAHQYRRALRNAAPAAHVGPPVHVREVHGVHLEHSRKSRARLRQQTKGMVSAVSGMLAPYSPSGCASVSTMRLVCAEARCTIYPAEDEACRFWNGYK